MTACIRGCLRARAHATDCPGDDCMGCMPRPAEHGLLCFGCHSRLRNLLQNAHGQWVLLLGTAGKSMEQILSAETTAKTHQQPRTTSDGRFPAPFARMVATAAKSEPVRIAAMDAAQELADWLSRVVELVIEAHNLLGPRRLPNPRDAEGDERAWKWRSVSDVTGTKSKYDPVVTRSDGRETMVGQWVLTDPDSTFAVDVAADFLLAWLDRFEAMDLIGDELEAFSEVMSQGHALAPWRVQVARLTGIPCPECHRPTLVRYGGDEDVTCLKCRATIGPGRYAIWTRMLAEKEGA